MDKGFIKLNRKFFDHQFWRDERSFSLAEAWIDLLQSARFEVAPCRYMVGMKSITINRGELRASQRFLAKRWQWSVGKVNRFISFLEDERMITRRCEHSETIITICKYDIYNSVEKGSVNTNEHSNTTPSEHPQTQRIRNKESEELFIDSVEENSSPPKSKIELRIEREKLFYNQVAEFKDQYSKEMLCEFFDYWSEPNKTGAKMKFEMEKTWDLSRRLKKWKSNNEKWNKTPIIESPSNSPSKRNYL